MIGDTSTLPAGYDATVTTSYDSDRDVVYFNFGIPKGDKGDLPDTSEYVRFVDVASQVKTGTVLGNSADGFMVDANGKPYSSTFTDEQYQGISNNAFISKGTLVNAIQSQIDAITASSDVVDIVGTYTDLQNYDTSELTNDDIIKVLDDSTHSDALSYYRWVVTGGTGAWQYVGSEGPFYTKSEIQAAYATIAYVNEVIGDIPGLLERLDVGEGIWEVEE